jgi:hypothetical protein
MAAGLDGCGFEDAVPDGDFFGAARGMAVAWLEAGRDMFVSATGGTEEGTQRLLQVLQAIAKGGGRSRRPQIGAQVPQCVFIPLGGAETLLVATEKDLCFLALVPDARSAGLAETWHVYSSVSGRR